MRRFELDFELFHRMIFPKQPAWMNQVASCVANLCEAYGLQGRNVLSVGGGNAHEEYFLHACGCNISVVDIDEGGGIVKILDALPPWNGNGRPLVFYLGDATVEHLEQCAFDILYFSGFTPDELRRDTIKKKIAEISPAKPDIDRFSNRAEWLLRGPYHPIVLDYADKYLSMDEGSLLVMQSYCGGVDVARHPGYVEACKAVLAGHGMVISDVYIFDSHPWVMLTVASRGARVTPRVPITNFHGRSEVARNIVKLY